METFTTNSVKSTIVLGRKLARRFDRGDCLGLIGQLGAGKTVLVKGLAEGMGADPQLVSSPSYVLVQEYLATVPVFHIDLYRLIDPPSELDGLGLAEMLDAGLVIIEWADRAEGALPLPRWQMRIEIAGPKSRRFILERLDASIDIKKRPV